MKRTILLLNLALAATAAQAQTAVEAWSRRYSNPTYSSDQANKLVTDSAGSVIVAGDSDNGITGWDWLIIKYSSAGIPLWTNRYNGSGNVSDQARGIVVDENDNIYVTGNSTGYVTIKYSSDGLPLWTNRYNGSGNGNDYATAIATDGNGNIYVTGYSAGNGTSYDYATIAYSITGTPLWVRRYNGPGNTDDRANAVTADGIGNVYVTGNSSSGYGAYATIAYSSAGLALWTNRFNGYGGAIGIAVNGNGVYVTGAALDSSSYADYGTIAYSTAGAPLWTNRYGTGPAGYNDQATAIVAAKNGNVYVTGTSADNYYATVAYSSAGAPLWTNHDIGLGGRGGAIAADENSNVYVTGSTSSDYGTVAYSSAGALLWTNRYHGPGNANDTASGISVGKNGKVYVTGRSYGNGTLSDFATIAYSSAGTPLWTNCYNGPGKSTNQATALVMDVNRNVYVTGISSVSINSFPDYATIAYSSAGIPLWTNRYSGPDGYRDDHVTAIAADTNGSVFVTGYSDNSSSSTRSADYLTIKYSSTGVSLWTNRYKGPGGFILPNANQATAVAVGVSGNVYVTGFSYRSVISISDYATIAYSSVGIPLWTNLYSGPGYTGNNTDQANAIAVDGSDNVFVTGSSVGNGSSADFATVGYSFTGVPLWTNRWNGSGNGVDQANGIVVDKNGTVYVTGYSDGGGGNFDYATIAYSNAGTPLWTNLYNGSGNTNDYAAAIVADGNANVHVTGYSTGNGSSYDYATIAYSSAGQPIWTNRYNGLGNGDDRAAAITMDGSANVYVTGNSEGNSGSADCATIAYSSAGLPLWTNRYSGGRAAAITADTSGNVFVVGLSSDGTNTEYLTIKYTVSVPVEIEMLDDQVVLSWTNAAFGLQSAPAITGTFTNIPGSTSPYTNLITGAQQFFRLISN